MFDFIAYAQSMPFIFFRESGAIYYCKNKNHEVMIINDFYLNVSGYKKDSHVIGKNDFNLPWSKYASHYIVGDETALSGQTVKVLEPFKDADGNHSINFCIKKPIIDNTNQIQGTIGKSVVLSDHDLKKWIPAFEQDKKYYPTEEYRGYLLVDMFPGLTIRESEVIYYIIRGYTTPSIANLLFTENGPLSKRSVESYIKNIKIKYQCDNKEQLINLCVSLGYVKLLPNSIAEKMRTI